MLKHVTLKPGLEVVQGQFKMAPFDRPCTTFYCCVFFRIFMILLEVNEFKKRYGTVTFSVLKMFFFHFKFYFGVIVTAPAENNGDYLK